MTRKLKRGISLLLVLCMTLGLLCTGALAEGPETETQSEDNAANTEISTETQKGKEETPADGEEPSADVTNTVPTGDASDAVPADAEESSADTSDVDQQDEEVPLAEPVETHIATYVGEVPAALVGKDGVSADQFNTAYETVKMTVDGTEYTVEVVPEGLVYFIDSKDFTSTSTAPYDAVKALVGEGLLNDKYDQQSDGSVWGLTGGFRAKGTDATTKDDKDYNGLYGSGEGGSSLTYALPLSAGEYTITSLHREWWTDSNNPTRPMKATIQVGDGEAAEVGNITLNGNGDMERIEAGFTVAEDSVVTYTVTSTGNNAPTISWLGVVKTGKYEAPENPDPEDPTIPEFEGFGDPLEDNDGLTLTAGAELIDAKGFGKMLKLNSGWNNEGKYHANIKDMTAFKSGAFTVVMDVKLDDADAKAAILSIGADKNNGDNSLRLFQNKGGLGYGKDNGSGMAVNQATLTGVKAAGEWNSVAMTYEEKDGKSAVIVYVNGAKAGEVEDVGFRLSEMASVSAMVGRGFNTSFMPTGLYDGILVAQGAADEATLTKLTAERLAAQNTAALPEAIEALNAAVATAEALIAGGVTSEALTAALADAKAVLEKENATLDEINAALNALRAATPNLGEVVIKGSDVDTAAQNINGLTYKGFGMLNGNSTSNLMLDYKAEDPDAYWAMMEYLFGGDHPIFTHIKMEMGNDGNNSTGPDACTMRYENEEADVSRSPGFVMAADAKKINPDVKVSFLRWGAPKWVNDAGFGSNTEAGYEAMYKWYRETIFDAYEKYGYVVDMVNPDTNETGNPNDKFIKWYASRVANETEFPDYFTDEAKAAYKSIRIIASDENKGLQIVPHMRKDAALYDAVDIIGFHYRSSATSDYIKMADEDDKEVWYSEGCATFGYSEYQENKNIEYGAGTIGGFQGPLALMDHFITSFEGSRRTHYIFQPAVGGFYEGIQYGHKELLSARDPWSGYIHYDPALYMLEHFTAFANMGWENEDNTAGIWRAIPGASKGGYGPSDNEHATAGQDGRAGYLTLVSPDKSDFSVVFVNNTRGEKIFTIKAENLGVAEGQQLAVWTTETDSYLQKTGTVDCVDGAWIVKLPAYSIVTATTLTDAEPQRAPVDGVHNEDRTVLDTDSTGRNNNVTDDDYLYADDFDYAEEPDMEQYNVLTGETNVSYLEARGNEPRYFLDTHGAWVVENGKLKQELPHGVGQWNNGDPATIVGDFRWMDYTASAEISFPEGAENGRWGGIGIRCQSGMNWNNSGYTLHIQKDGWWNLYRGGTKITSGNVDAKSSYTLTLMGLGDTITAIVDGDVVAAYTDPNPMLSGRVKFSCGWKQVYFDNFTVKTVKGGIPYALAMIDNQDDSVSYTGSWDIGHSSPAGGNADDWYRTLSKSKPAGASFSFPFTGTGFALIGSTGSGVKLKVTVDGELVGDGVSTVDVPKRYESYVLSGLENTAHTATVEVVSGNLTLDAIHFLGERLEADQDAVVSVKSVTVDTATSLKQLGSALPKAVTVTTVGGETKELPVEWNLPTEQELLSNAFKGLTLTGAVKDAVNPAGMAVTASASVTTVVPAGTVYYIDSVISFNDGKTAETTEPYEAVKKVMGGNLLNDKYDQLKTGGNTWGLVDQDAGTKSYTGTADPTATGIYGKDNKNGETLTYALTLPAGEYTLYSAHREWWGMDRPMKAAIKVGGTTVDGGVINLSKSSGDQFKQISFTVPEGGAVVEYTVTATGTQAPVISWLAVVRTGEYEHVHVEADPVRENVKEATCKTEGSYDEVVYCTLCGEELSRESKTIEKLAHTEETIPGKPAACTEPGLTNGTKCSVCGEILKAQEAIPAKGHNYGATWTWTGEDGSVSVVLTCGTCGDKVDDLTAEVTSETTPATAAQTGKTVYTATVTHDGKTYTDTHEVTIPATGSTVPSVTTFTLTVSYVFEDGTQAANTVRRSLSSGSRYNIASPAIEGYTPSQASVTGTLRANMSVTVTYVKNQEIEEPDTPTADVPVTEVFADVKDAWYTDAVAYVYAKGLMSGTAEDRFSPDATTTRGMMATIIYRMESEPEAPLASFSDVLAGAWYASAVSWAQKNGVILGYENGTFGPEDQITREQMVTIIYRYAQLKGYDTTGRADLSGYADAGELGDWAEEAMSWAVSVGLIQGTGTTTLSPKGSATRAQIALITMRMDQLFRGEAIA